VNKPCVVVLTAGRRDTVTRLRAILAAVPRGTVAVQVREKQLDGRPMLAFVREVIAAARPAGAQVWVNDRADVAAIAGADGVHLPETGLVVADARAAGRDLAIGCSRHDVAGVLAAARDGADLVQLGPIWETPGKGSPLGVGALAVRRELPARVRLVAVGGITTTDQVRVARSAGADAVAVIRAAWDTGDPAGAIAALVAASRQVDNS
jgi:thiamine-phosphate pyrophosphorylase